jgi:DNA-binding transcriptional LysR family regulator
MQTIRLFVEVARCRSFSKAAALFGISQSAASQRIGQLERRLGVKLIDRSVRPFELTQAGELYLVGAADTLKRLDRIEQEVSSLGLTGETLEGTVRVAAIYSAGIDLLSQLRDRFVAEYPEVQVELNYLKPEQVHRAVVDQQADLGIVSFPDRFTKVIVQPLREEAMAVVCRPDHALAQRKTVAASELTGLDKAGYDADLPIARHLQRYLKDNHASPTVAHRFDNLDTLKSAVAVTARFAIMPVRCVQHEVDAGTLRAIRLTPKLTRPMGVLTRSGTDELGPAAKALLKELIRTAGPTSGTQPDIASADASR